MARKKEAEVEKENGERWLLTYADMITLLLALFAVLYAISTVDAEKYAAIKDNMNTAFEGTGTGGGGGGGGGAGGFPDSFQSVADDITAIPGGQGNHFLELYKKLTEEVETRGYTDTISVIQSEAAIVVRFKDSVLFYPDSPEMNPAGFEAMNNIAATISEMGDAIGHIEIEGHTAFIGEEYDRSLVAWTLSADRAVAVLRYLSEKGGIEQSKMSIAGFSHFVPIEENDTEEGRAKNRRVELRISPPTPAE